MRRRYRSAVALIFMVAVRVMLGGVIGCPAGACLYSSWQARVEPPEFERYYSHDERISVGFPEGWEVVTEADISSIGGASPREGEVDAFRENAVVGSFEMGEEVELYEYVEGNLIYLQEQMPSVQLLSAIRSSLDGAEAIKIVYTTEIDGTRYRTFQVFAIKEGRGYIVTGMGEELKYRMYEEQFEQIISSFRFE